MVEAAGIEPASEKVDVCCSTRLVYALFSHRGKIINKFAYASVFASFAHMKHKNMCKVAPKLLPQTGGESCLKHSAIKRQEVNNFRYLRLFFFRLLRQTPNCHVLYAKLNSSPSKPVRPHIRIFLPTFEFPS